MQLGGNANANAFFKKHHCDTADTQEKYKSRAAQLYRDKLHSEASKALRVHGNKLFIDTAQGLYNVATVLFIFLYTPVKSYVVKWPQEK